MHDRRFNVIFFCLQVYEVTIFEEDDDDSFDEDTEITQAVSTGDEVVEIVAPDSADFVCRRQDYWSCDGCKESNPPLSRNCLRCWRLRRDWLHGASLPAQPAARVDAPGQFDDFPSSRRRRAARIHWQWFVSSSPPKALDAEDGVDVPDGKTLKTSSAPDSKESQEPPASRPPSSCSSSSQEKLWTCDSQASSLANSQETVGAPELERGVSAEMRLPESCLEPCLICQSRPKNGCIVHGKTGHLMTCYVCARKLKKHNKLCPVCRLPIQAVVFTYFS